MRLPNSPFVDMFYRMDPETDGLLSSPIYLQDGMRVLAEGDRMNTSTEAGWSKYEQDAAEMRNMWFTVTRVFVGEDVVTFVAIYDDGTRRQIRSVHTDAWLVKLDSVAVKGDFCKCSERMTICSSNSPSDAI